VFPRWEPSGLPAAPVVRLRQWTTAVDSARLTAYSSIAAQSMPPEERPPSCGWVAYDTGTSSTEPTRAGWARRASGRP